MAPSNAMENDKKRLRNQFTKDERSRLLAIMTEYGPLLDDKNISILSRKEIWEIIENKFNENGHSGRTSAQLKKYWQNYKYHSKRAKIIQKEVPKTLSPITKQMVRMLAKVNPEDWALYDVKPGVTQTKTSPGSSQASSGLANVGVAFCTTDSNIAVSESGTGSCSPVFKNRASTPQRSSKLSASGASSSAGDSRAKPRDGGLPLEGRKETAESNVVFATTDAPGSSVTVSVICPEVQSKVRSIFWKRNAPPPDPNAKLQFGYGDEGRNSAELVNSDVSHDANADAKFVNRRWDKFAGEKNGNRSTLVGDAGIFGVNKSKRSSINVESNSDKRCGGIREVQGMDDQLIRCVALPRRGFGKNQSSISVTEATTGRENQSNFIGNVPGVVKEISRAGEGRVSRDCEPANKFERSHSMINEENEMKKVSTSGGVPKRLGIGAMPSQDNLDVKDVDGDYPDFNETPRRFAAAKSFRRSEILDDIKEMLETFKATGETAAFDGDGKGAADLTRCGKSRGNPSTQDFSWLKLYLKLLREVAAPGGSHEHLKELQKFGNIVSTANSAEKLNADTEGTSDSDPIDAEQVMELEEGGNSESGGAGKLRVRRVSSMTPVPSEDQVYRREIKVETEEGQENADPQADDQVNAIFGNERVVDSMNCLMQAKLRSARSEMEHRLKLQKLEIAEKELRVKIAETSVQEARLRIQALVEERIRAKEIHELQLAQISAENARSEAEHAARLDASSVAAAESRSRLSSVERDRERSENFYQMQLRYMSGGGNGVNNDGSLTNVGNGLNSVDCKRSQH